MKKLFLFLLFLEIANATSLGVLEQGVTINALKGVETNTYLTLFNPNEYDVTITIQSNSEWIHTKNAETRIAAKQSKQVPLRVLVSSDTQNGLYDFILLAVVEQQQKQVQLAPAIGIPVKIEVTGEEIAAFEFISAQASNGEIGTPLSFSVQLQNKGNVLLKPEIQVTIRQQEQEKTHFNQTTLLFAGETKTEILHWTPQEEGEYKAEIIVAVKGITSLKKELFFNVQDEGYFSRSGSFTSFLLNTTPKKNMPVKIIAVFANNGTLPADAKLVAEVYRGNKLEQVLESEKIIIDENTQGELITYFTPQENDQYSITGKVVYAGKETDEKKIDISVFSPLAFLENEWVTNALFTVLGISILGLGYFALMMWRKQRKVAEK